MSLFSDKLFTQNPGSGSGGDGASWGNITGTLSDQTDLQTALSDKQDNLESGTNIKTVNGASLLGEGNLAVKTYQSFGSSWHTNTSFTEFLDDVRDDSTAVQGMAYLGELRCSGLPSGLVNVEAVVEIMTGSTASSKVIHVVITSGNLDPYRWEYTYWNSGQATSGWVAFQPKLTAGGHISIQNNVISQNGADLSNVSSEGSVQLVEEKNGFGINSDTWAYLKLDGNLNNSNPYTPNLTVETEQGSPEFTSATGGVFNNGLVLGGAYLFIDDVEKKTTANNITIDFWLLTPSLTGQKTILINYGELGVASNQVAIIFYPTNNGLVLYLYDFDTRSGDYNYVDGVIDTGYWTHYCLTIGNYKNASHTYSLGFSTPDLDITVEDYLAFAAPKTACPGGLNDFSFYATFADATIDEIHIQNKIFSNWYLMDSQYTLEQPTGNYTIDSSEVATQSDLANYVTTNTAQSITAPKTFNQLSATMVSTRNLQTESASFINQTYQNRPLIFNKISAYTLNNSIVKETQEYLTGGTTVTKATQVTSFDGTNNTATYSITAGPDASHQAGIEITGDANGKANLILTNPDIAANDNSNKVPTTAWVKAKVDNVYENSYRPDNLQGGSNINIVETTPTVPDTNLVACWHFDTDLVDIKSGQTLTLASGSETFSDTTNTYKFTKSLVLGSRVWTTLSSAINLGSTFTIDFWINFNSTEGISFRSASSNPEYYINVHENSVRVYKWSSDSEENITIATYYSSVSGMNHFAIECNNKTFKVFLNGVDVTDTSSAYVSWWADSFDFYKFRNQDRDNALYIDELRLSNNVRWASDFTPPTEPYTTDIQEDPINIINFDPTTISGYNASGTYVLKLVDGVLTWVAE